MGSDYSSHQMFCGDTNHASCRSAIVETLTGFLQSIGYVSVAREEAADRSFVLGSAGRWLHVGDSFGSTEYADLPGFNAVSEALSCLCPVVNIHMSDDAALHLYLYRAGALADKFGNMAFPFLAFATEEAAREYQGHPDLWTAFLLDKHRVADLRAAWTQNRDLFAQDILARTADLFGLHPELIQVGYTHDIEGIPIKWDEYLEGEIEIEGFQEFHWKRKSVR